MKAGLKRGRWIVLVALGICVWLLISSKQKVERPVEIPLLLLSGAIGIVGERFIAKARDTSRDIMPCLIALVPLINTALFVWLVLRSTLDLFAIAKAEKLEAQKAARQKTERRSTFHQPSPNQSPGRINVEVLSKYGEGKEHLVQKAAVELRDPSNVPDTRIVARIKTQAYLDTVRKRLPAGLEDQMAVATWIAGDLFATLAFDMGETFVALTERELARRGRTKEDLMAQALRNSESAFRSIKAESVQAGPQTLITQLVGNAQSNDMEAATMLLPSIWNGMVKQFDDNVVAIFPHNNRVYCCAEASGLGAFMLRNFLTEQDFLDAHSLSNMMYIWKGSAWSAWDPDKAVWPGAPKVLRPFSSHGFGFILWADAAWQDASDEKRFALKDTLNGTQITASAYPRAELDLEAFASRRFDIVTSKMPYFQRIRPAYPIAGISWQGMASEFRGVTPVEAEGEEMHMLVLCVVTNKKLISLNITARASAFDQHGDFYRWLLEHKLDIHG